MSLTLERGETVTAVPRAIRDVIRVLLIQSQRLVGDALELLLNDQPDMIVTGKLMCESGAGTRALALGADVVIIDFRMNLTAALQVATEIRRSRSSVHMIALTRDQADHTLLVALEAGVSGSISESDGSTSVVSSVRRAAQGMTLIPPDVIAQLLKKRRLRDEPNRRLTRREGETLSLLADGLSSREIANTLGVSYLTVRTHIRNLAVKLAAHSKVEVVAKAYQLDLVAPYANGHRAGVK